MGVIKIKTIQRQYRYGEFNSDSFPKELTGIIPPKEYLRCMEIMSNNLQRHFVSYLLILAPLMYFFIGGVIALAIMFSELIRWILFKKNLTQDFNTCIEYLNNQVSRRNIKFELRSVGGYFGGSGSIRIIYPDSTVVLSQAVALDNGKNALVMEPFMDTAFIVDYGFKNESGTPILRANTIIGKLYRGMGLGGNNGFDFHYDLSLFNYLTETEVANMVEDFQSLKTHYNYGLTVLFFVAFVLSFTFFGLVLWIPFFIWYIIERKKAYRKLIDTEAELVLKYNNMYLNRNIAIRAKSAGGLLRHFDILIPSDCGQAPILTKYIGTEEYVISLNIPNGFAPIRAFSNNMNNV
ncbi:hypothetical protein ACTA71_001933 [Dictyostelium dimigraforme]